jgi:hypothetical protein
MVVVTAAGETRHATGDRLPPHPALPGLEPPVERFSAGSADEPGFFRLVYEGVSR